MRPGAERPAASRRVLRWTSRGGDRTPSDPFDAGPFARIEAALHLSGQAAWGGALRRAGIGAAVAWVPPLLLTALAGPTGGMRSFLTDASTHVHYLVALPLLFLAEPWCLPRLAVLARHFMAGGLIDRASASDFDALIARARRALEARGTDITIALAAWAGAVALSLTARPPDVPLWMDAPPGTFTPAGWWRVLVSHPLMLLAIFAWLWRVIVWARLLDGIARLRLNLVPAHPDATGGLGFLALSLRAFAPVALALGAVAAGASADVLLVPGDAPRWNNLFVVAGVIVVLFTAPLLVFAPSLHRARLRGVFEYGTLAGELGRRFEDRWMRRPRDVQPEALEANDFSATTDLYSIAANVWRMKLVPLTVKDVAVLAVASLLPFVPFAMVVLPAGEILKGLASVFL